MEVILKENIPAVGRMGQVIRVRNGFARNFLIPKGKALPATAGNLKILEQQKKSIEAEQDKLREAASELSKKLEALEVLITVEVGEEGKLFGSVTSQDIAAFLAAKELAIDKKIIQLNGPIKELGESEAKVRLHPDVEATLKIKVEKK